MRSGNYVQISLSFFIGHAARLTAVLAIVVISTLACGLTRSEWSYLQQVRDVDQLADDGEYEVALARYIELSDVAEKRVDLMYLRYRSALMLHKLERYDEALVAYEDIWRNPGSVYDDYPARALNKTASIYADAFGDEESAEEIYWGVIRAYPNSSSADDALFKLARMYEDEPGPFIEKMEEIYVPLQETEIADNLIWEIALRIDEDFDDCMAAMNLYNILATRFQRSGFVDNGIWNTGLCLREHGQIEDEYELLEDFVGAREVSILIGDYNYKYYAPAFFRLAEIEEERGDLPAAIRWYRSFQRTFKFSLEWDDVQSVVVEHLLTLGRRDEAERALEVLKKEWPQSRYIEQIKNLLAYGGGEVE